MCSDEVNKFEYLLAYSYPYPSHRVIDYYVKGLPFRFRLPQHTQEKHARNSHPPLSPRTILYCIPHIIFLVLDKIELQRSTSHSLPCSFF